MRDVVFCPFCGAVSVVPVAVQVFVQAGPSWGDSHDVEELASAHQCGGCGGEFITLEAPLAGLEGRGGGLRYDITPSKEA